MIVTPTALQAMFTGYNKHFQDGLAAAESDYEKVATTIPSTSRSNTYGWLGKYPRFREWVGDRVFNNMKSYSYAITNKKYEDSVEVERDDIEDDNIGIYNPLFKEIGQATKEFPDEMVFGLLSKGFDELCYDQQNFFDMEHPVYPKVDGTGDPRLVSNMQDGPGKPWFLLDTTRALKPLIWQTRRPFVLTAKVDPKNSEATWLRDVYQYSVDGRANAGFGFWQMAFASRAELNIDNLRAARKAMEGFRADGEKKLKVRPKLLVVDTDDRDKAEDILDKQLINAGESNPMYKKFDLLVTPFLN